MILDILPAAATEFDAPPFELTLPPQLKLPIVLTSPHSGTFHPPSFLAQSPLTQSALRRSEDSFIDRLFLPAAELGAPLLRALYARAYLDLNREPFELDPEMFHEALPPYVNTRSPRVAAGLGTIAKFVSFGTLIYRDKLRYDEAVERIEQIYHPYHAKLSEMLAMVKRHFGVVLLLDCHSMPSAMPSAMPDQSSRCDIVIGDCFGTSSPPALTLEAERLLRTLGYIVRRNNPYAGGYTTRHYGSPDAGCFALQIELRRSLYMDEETFQPHPNFVFLARQMANFIEHLSHFVEHTYLRH